MIRNRDLMATPPYYISAYGIWLKLGNQGTEQDFIDSLQGADGEKTLIQYNGATGNLEWKHENGENWDVLVSFTDIISQGEADVIAACLTYANTAQLHSEAAASSADDAQGYASAASASATAAESSAASAANHANDASDYAGAAEGYAEDAQGYASAASASATAAEGYAEDAQGYASAASASKTAAESSAAEAANHANNAYDYATAAATLGEDIANYANAASASKTAAQSSASAAAGSASTATDRANDAAGYATTAQNSAAAASASASTAATQASSASNSATAASSSADSASGSAASASGYATAASTSAGEAAASAAAAEAAASGMLPTDYETLTNKPQINSVELSGNKSLTDLGIASATALAGKQDKLTAGTNITISGTTISATDTKDYNALSNRPQIAGETLSGNKTLAQLGIAPATHTHSDYALTTHTHSVYAAASHTHSEYAAVAHNHDSSYAAATHVHAGYAQVLVFQNISVAASAWESDSTYTDYPFSATVTATGVTADHLPEVNFGAVEAAGGNFAPVALSGAGTVKIYAKAKPTAAITIPSILCTKAVT